MSMSDSPALRGPARLSFALTLALVGSGLVQANAQAQPQVPAQQADKPLVVHIAHGGPVSGPIAALGKDEENGVRMAIEELNARKLQLGGRPVQWKLEAGDDVGDPGQAAGWRGALRQEGRCRSGASAVGHHLARGQDL